jgi:sugar transferase (PEP-CTERM system associated)
MIRLFRVSIPAGVLVLLLSEILLTSLCFGLAAFLVLRHYDYDLTTYYFDDGGLARMALVVTSIILGLHFSDLYTRIHVKSRTRLLQDLTQVIGAALLAQGLIAYATPTLRLGRGIMLVGTIISSLALFFWRIFYDRYLLDAVAGDRILFVGSNQVVVEIVEHIATHRELGLSVIGYLINEAAPGTDRNGSKVLGPVSDLNKIAMELRPSRIVVGLTERRQALPVPELLELRFSGFAIEEAGATYEAVCGRICTKELRPSQLIFSGDMGPRRHSLFIQNILNLSIAVIGCLLTVPIMAAVALGVKLTSAGPVLYRQRRVGKNGETFVLYKFRSMRSDAEAATGAVWASPDDPRVTGFGTFLRQVRLDELPQLWNVLRGEMSLVGPRPERPEFVKTLAEQIPYYRQRHCVKPGITGWAQINHKYGDTLEDTVTKLEYDLYYIKNISPGLDMYIVFHTVKTMILTRGAQ